MKALEAELAEARALDVTGLADAIESIGFECTRCGACCRAESSGDVPLVDGPAGDAPEGDGGDPHTATVFPDEVRQLLEAVQDDSDTTGEDVGSTGDAVDAHGDASGTAYDWRDVARPLPYGLEAEADGGETFEWALQTDDCGDCTFYRGGTGDEPGTCNAYGDRPLICRTYPFSVALAGTAGPIGEPVDSEGLVRAHECEGLGRDIDRAAAEDLARSLKERAIRDLEEAIALRDAYDPVDVDGVVVHDSEGAKRPDGNRVR